MVELIVEGEREKRRDGAAEEIGGTSDTQLAAAKCTDHGRLLAVTVSRVTGKRDCGGTSCDAQEDRISTEGRHMTTQVGMGASGVPKSKMDESVGVCAFHAASRGSRTC